jgi:stage II sporulation protein D
MGKTGYRDRTRALYGPVGKPLVWGAAGMTAFLIVVLLLPSVLVNRFEVWLPQTAGLPLTPKEELHAEKDAIQVSVYLTGTGETVSLPLEAYVRGVIAAEMPPEFELEALKAQAIAARTYIIRRLRSGDFSDLPEGADGAVVTDTVQHQAFATEEALRERWGWLHYSRNLDKMTRAVNETEGIILTYAGEPIDAVFFSASNGFTENSEDYWVSEIPYLRSVESPWDEQEAPNFERLASFSIQEMYERLGLAASSGEAEIEVLERSESGRVLKVSVAGKEFTGREMREKLGLASNDFTWEISGETILFTTKGFGHGVGMSQWGANGMAKEGKTAEEILRHYYSGVELENI